MCLREQKKENYNLCSSRKCLCSLRSEKLIQDNFFCTVAFTR